MTEIFFPPFCHSAFKIRFKNVMKSRSLRLGLVSKLEAQSRDRNPACILAQETPGWVGLWSRPRAQLSGACAGTQAAGRGGCVTAVAAERDQRKPDAKQGRGLRAGTEERRV